MRLMTESPTDRALAAFDAFLTEWIPHAIHDQVFGHHTNAADTVRRAIHGIVDQRALSLKPGPLGYAVLQQDVIHSRDYKQGLIYTTSQPHL